MIEIFGLVGLTLIVTRSRIFEKFRQWWLDRRPNDLGIFFHVHNVWDFGWDLV